MHSLVVIVVALAAAISLRGQTADPFAQPIANPLEGRIQVFATSADALRFDIGASPSLYAPDSTIRIRADFFTLSRMRSAEAVKFPVETIDYWFGLSAAWRPENFPLSMRLRLAHISAHFVDGTPWPFRGDSTVPIYSREFAELLVSGSIGNVRLYGGPTIIWSGHNPEFSRVIPQIGAELRQQLGASSELQAAYDGKLVGYRGTYLPQHCLQVGLVHRHKTDVEGGIFLYRYDGRSIHGMFAGRRDSYWALGIRLGMP
ncbi:MAG: hypothetical protein FGM33_00650 [Candidatus Kapabacteria bacterium]|nr:hypothetical protein [Candidatus Kapabacteria bacterium]